MKKRATVRWFGRFPNCRSACVCAGLIIMGILLLKQLQSKDDAPGFASAALMASNGPAIHPGVPWYIRSGQWHADLRTLTELLRYLEDSGEFVQTNPIPAKADNA